MMLKAGIIEPVEESEWDKPDASAEQEKRRDKDMC
jgi:hypothetical protein